MHFLRAEDIADSDSAPPLQERVKSACQITENRVRKLLDAGHVTRAINHGAGSYLFELLKQPSYPEQAEAAFLKFWELNGAEYDQANGVPLEPKAMLRQLAAALETADHDWISFSSAWLEPGEVNLDRIRENLKRTPLERLERHTRILRQLNLLRNARRRT